MPNSGEPIVFFNECELIGISYHDIVYSLVPDACYMLIRTWNVINWCLYDDFGFNAFQETGFSELDLSTDWDGDGDKDYRTFREGWNTSGTPGIPDGYLTYRQKIKVIDNDAPVFGIPYIDGCIVDWECSKDLTIPFPLINDDCSPEIEVDVSGDFGNANNIIDSVVVLNIGIGEYEVTYTVTDNCGNTASQTKLVVVQDCVLPIPVCKYGLIAEITFSGTVEILASMLDEYSYDNCGDITHFSFSQDINDTSSVFTCDELGFQSVQLWVTDDNGNQNSCETNIEIQDNQLNCNTLTIAGAIASEQNAGVEDVDVQVNGGLFSELTGLSGDFTFYGLTPNGDYTITPHLDANPANGVTTWDLVLITRHILGIQLLDSPYKIIAADANKSNTVTTLDMVGIRKVILQIETGFPNNTSWRFVDKDYLFPSPADPWADPAGFPEVINYNNLTADDLLADFVAVKVGDVNGSAATNANAGAQSRTFHGTMQINATDRQLKAGKTCSVPFTSEAMELLGYQFTLHYAPEAIEVLEITEGLASRENFGRPELGVITTSWNASGPRAMTDGEVLFSLIVKAKADLSLREVFGVSSAYTPAEAYDSQGGLLDVILAFNGLEADNLVLFQNVPNPWKDQTVIGFILPEAGKAELTIFDETGRALFSEKGDFEKGYNAFVIENRKFSSSGLFHYRVQTEKCTETRVMVRLVR